MDKLDEIEFIFRLPLKGLSKLDIGYRCSCPICGDSKKNSSKKRLYILTKKKDYITVMCHNCFLTTNLKNFISLVSDSVYEEYLVREKEEYIKKLKSGELFSKRRYENADINNSELKYIFQFNKKNFLPATKSKQCIEYCKQRKIPNDRINELLFCINPKMQFYKMLIFPFKIQNKYYGFQGRRLDKKQFLTFSKNDSFKVYNFFNVDLDEPVYVFESIIDSMFMENSIAMVGADLSENVLSRISKPIFVLDSDRTGKIKTLKYLEQGHKCFIYPDSFKYKDVNEAIMNGVSIDRIRFMIKENIYSGLMGITKIKIKLREKQ